LERGLLIQYAAPKPIMSETIDLGKEKELLRDPRY